MAQGIITDDMIKNIVGGVMQGFNVNPVATQLAKGMIGTPPEQKPWGQGISSDIRKIGGVAKDISAAPLYGGAVLGNYLTNGGAPDVVAKARENLDAANARLGLTGTNPAKISNAQQAQTPTTPQSVPANPAVAPSPTKSMKDMTMPTTLSDIQANEFPTTETTPNKNTTPAPSTEMSGILPDGSYGIFGTKQDNTAYHQERDIANARIDAQRAEDLKKVELDNAIFKEENRVLGGGTDPETLRYLKQQKYGAKGINPMQDVQSREANATTRFGMEKNAETAKANQQATQDYRRQQLEQTAQKLAWDEKVDYTKLNQEQQKTYLDQADKLLKRDADYSGRLWTNFEVRDNDGTGNPQPEKTLFNIAKSGVKLPETDTNLINMVNQMNQRRLAFQRSKYGDAKLTTEQLAQIDKDFMETLK
jgi:hypothetical protein